MEEKMDDDAASTIDARLNGLSGAICALVAAMVARGDIEKGVVIGTLAAYRDAATKTNADAAGLAEVDRLIVAIDAVRSAKEQT
jgi:hypothetical protein